MLNKKPTTLNEAIELVTFQEHNFKATVGRDQELFKRERTRRVSWMDEVENVSDDEVDVRRMDTQSYVTLDDLDEKLKKLELKFVQEQEKRMERIEKLFSARAGKQGQVL